MAESTSHFDFNHTATLIGVSNSDFTTPVTVAVDPATHRVLTSATGGTPTFIDNEIVAGSGTTFTLISPPVSNSEHVFGGGGRLTKSVDYSISGAVITILVGSYGAGTVVCDYRI